MTSVYVIRVYIEPYDPTLHMSLLSIYVLQSNLSEIIFLLCHVEIILFQTCVCLTEYNTHGICISSMHAVRIYAV